MTETREFGLGDVLSVTTGRLVSPDGMPGIYRILEWMTGGPVHTHQLPRIMDEARPVLLAAHPRLADIDGQAFERRDWRTWLDARIAEIGETLPVPRMTADQHERIDPVSEAARMFAPDRITVVAVGKRA